MKCLAQHLGKYVLDDELRLFYFDFKRNGIPFLSKSATQKTVRWIPGRAVQTAWKTIGWPPYNWFAGHADLFHFTNFVRPPISCGRSIVTIYDVSFLRFPEAAEPRNFAHLNHHIRETVRRTDAVFTISEFSRREIAELLPIPASRIHAIHPGLDNAIKQPSGEQVQTTRRALQLNRPYLLFVGTIEPRKNIPFLVDVFDQLDEFDGELILAGMKGWKVEPILQHIASAKRTGSIRYIDYVPEEHLSGLYAGAELFIFPSLYEGFGFPPLEAMACGTPVLSSSGGSLPEILGDAAVILTNYEVASWVGTIHHMLHDTASRTDRVASGLRHVQRYTWDQAAKATWDVYREVAG